MSGDCERPHPSRQVETHAELARKALAEADLLDLCDVVMRLTVARRDPRMFDGIEAAREAEVTPEMLEAAGSAAARQAAVKRSVAKAFMAKPEEEPRESQ